MITLKRSTGYADKMRAYKVLLDGNAIGSIRQGESKEYPLQAGKHTLQLKIDWCTSKPITFDFTDKPLTFECGSNTALKAAFSAFFNIKDYMWLKQTA